VNQAAATLVQDPGTLAPGWSCTPAPNGSLHELLGAGGGRSFETSGSGTGEPTSWWRSADQLAREAAVTVAALPDDIDRIVTTVAPTSLYGYALGVLTPLELGVPVRHQQLLLRDLDLRPGHTLVVTVAPGWCTGPSLPPPPPGCTVTFVHAGSMLPPRARTLVDAHPDTRILELFGSTETGLLSTRLHYPGAGSDRDPWTLVDDVELVADHQGAAAEVALTVRSPRIGVPTGHGAPDPQHTLGDWVTVIDDRRFRFDGRRERLAKPGGRNVDLDRLEAQIGEITRFRIGLACVAAMDPEGGEVVVLEVEGDESLAREVEGLLRLSADVLPIRPRVVAVDHILRSPMGKPRPLRLAA
jgi:acyl-coenzyme A synthetase/AMP-(fatty) acid ligase